MNYLCTAAKVDSFVFSIRGTIAILTAGLAVGALLTGVGCRSNANIPVPLALRATVRGSDIELNWNADSTVILLADRAVLKIDEGAFQKEIELNREQLRSRSLIYSPATAAVTFQLIVYQQPTIENVSARLAPGIAIQPEPVQPQPSDAGDLERRSALPITESVGSGYAVQLGIFATWAEAERYAAVIRRERVRSEIRSSGESWRLWAGCASDSQTAAALAGRLRQRFPGAAVVRGCDPMTK